MNKDNLFWGVVFLMAAIYILMRSVGMAPDVSIVRIIIGLLCITGFIKAAIDLEFGGMLFSLAILFIVFRRYRIGKHVFTVDPDGGIIWNDRIKYAFWRSRLCIS